MPGTPTTRYAIPTLAGADLARDIDTNVNSALTSIDGKFAGYSQGVFASRPVSTGGSPGITGRLYYATDTAKLYHDFGTGWNEVRTAPAPSSGKSIIATSEARTNVAYGLLTTPDRVQGIVLPTDGLIAVAYQAQWQQSVAAAARAAIFIGSNQLKVQKNDTSAPTTTAAMMASGTALDGALNSYGGGLAGGDPNTGYTAPVTTGQAVGSMSTGTYLASSEVGGIAVTLALGAAFGACYIFAAAGSYDISVMFKSSSGSVTVKNRSLWVWTLGF